ncbi:MAG: sigma-70 family RNA polymerase sigma factor [Verrucomicrobiota bacterium]
MMRNEGELIRRYLRNGEVAAVHELLSAYEDGLYRYLWQMLRHQQDSEDALQETFRKALKALPNYREENYFKSWLFRIGHNTALDLIRRRKKVVEMGENEEETIGAEGAGPGEVLEASERIAELRSAVARLPESEREVVTLRLQEDLSFREIAEVVGAPLGTVLSRMRNAKQRLKIQLATL